MAAENARSASRSEVAFDLLRPRVVDVEIYYLRHGPDGLTRITLRTIGSIRQESWLAPTSSATASVLRRWADHHRRLLGYYPAAQSPWTGESAGS